MKHLLTILLIVSLAAAVSAQDSVWTRIYKPAEYDYSDVLNGGCAASDGNLVFVGYTTSFQIWVGDCYLMKINTDGDTCWTAHHGSPYRDYGYDVVETYDGGLAAVGYGRVNNDTENYRVRLYRTDSTGNLLWEKAFTGANSCNTYGLTGTSDSGYAIVGYTGPYGNYDMFIIRTDSLGDSLWMATFGGADDEQANAVAETNDGGFMIVGTTESYGAGSSDIYVVRTNSSGDSLWTKTFGDTLGESAYGIEKTSDGAFVIVGNSVFPEPQLENRMYLIKIQDNGDTAWTTSILGGTSASARAVCEANDGGFIMAGVASYGYPKDEDVLVAKVDANGDSLWAVNYGGNAYDIARFVYQADDGYIYVGGTYAASAYGDFYALKLVETSVGVEIVEETIIPRNPLLSQNYPNPFNPSTTIKFNVPRRAHVKLSVYNLLGQRITQLVNEEKPVGDYAIHWDGTDESGKAVATGMYLYRLKISEYAETKKMLLLK